MSFLVREPTPADVDALADLHVTTWRETYDDLTPAAHHGTGVGQALCDAVFQLQGIRLVR